MRHSILVADDDDAIRHTVRRALEQAGFDVCEAANGVEADRACAAAAFDLAIVDVLMPQRDGLETILSVRKRQPNMKIIAMSGASDDMFLENAMGLGATRGLRKPFRPPALLKMVNDLLGLCPAR